jgi:hypothetical protein
VSYLDHAFTWPFLWLINAVLGGVGSVITDVTGGPCDPAEGAAAAWLPLVARMAHRRPMRLNVVPQLLLVVNLWLSGGTGGGGLPGRLEAAAVASTGRSRLTSNAVTPQLTEDIFAVQRA